MNFQKGDRVRFKASSRLGITLGRQNQQGTVINAEIHPGQGGRQTLKIRFESEDIEQGIFAGEVERID